MKFSIGGAEKERLEVCIQGYSCQEYDNVSDANWLSATASISAGSYKGSISLMVLAPELTEFYSQVSTLYETLIGDAVFNTLEDQLSIRLSGDGIGHIHVEGYIKDEVGVGYNKLVYELSIDQTELKTVANQLRKVLSAYPVRTA